MKIMHKASMKSSPVCKNHKDRCFIENKRNFAFNL